MATQPTPNIVTSATAQGVDRAQTPKVAPAFARPSLPTPDKTFPVGDILDFVLFDLGPERLPAGGYFFREELISTCTEFGLPFREVLNELRRQTFAYSAINGTLNPEDVCMTRSGILVNMKAIRAILGGLLPICPRKGRFISVKRFQSYCTEWPCGSVCCSTCGPEQAEKLFDLVRTTVLSLDKVYVSSCPWEKALSGRLAQRRRDRAMQTIMYRRVDGVAFIVSDKPHGGLKPPTSCQAMTPAEALEWFRDVIFVPGRVRVDWSDGWRPPKDPKGIMRGDIDVRHLTDSQVERVMAHFYAEAKKQFGVEIETGYWPRALQPKLDEMARKLVVDAGG